MLKLFRQRKSIIKVLLWGIVLVVGFMMVVTLVPGLGGGYGTAIDSPDVVATVGEQVVTAQEVQRQVSWWQNRQGLSNPLLRRFFAEQVIEDLVFQHALEHEAGRLGLEVTPEEVAAQIRRMPELNPGGKFVGAAEYQRLVQQERMTVGEFEERVRSQRLQLKLYHLLTDGLQVSEAEVEQAFRARNEKVAVEYALFKPRTLEDEIHPTAEELRAYFEQNRTRYALPERRRVRYVEVEFAWAAARAPVTPQEIETHYQRNRESYRVPEQVRFRHILFRFPAAASEEQKEEVRRKGARVRAELARGREFATLAQQHSEDTATAEQGGDVGWVQRGQVVPALETVLFSLAEGALSEPVEVDYGIHIVRVTGHQQARVKPLEEVRTEIEPMLGQQKNQQEALKLAQQIAQDIRGGKTLPAAAEALGLSVQESPAFALTESLLEFAGTTSLQQTAFQLKPEEVSEPISVPAGYAVAQLVDIAPGHPAQFDEVRGEVERAFRQERSGELARERAQALAEAARKSGDLRAAARALRVEVKLSDLFTREESVPELGPARAFAGSVFSLPAGGIAGPVQVGVNWAVLRVAARQEVDSGVLAQQRGLLAAQFLQEKRELAFQTFREALKKRLAETGKLRFNQRALDRILGTS